MNFVLKIFFCLIVSIFAKTENDFIIDYFFYKDTPNVLGFSCNSKDENVNLIKDLNKIGIRAIFNDVYKNQTVYTHYSKLGIYLDFRCYDEQNISSALLEALDRTINDELYCWLVLGFNKDNIMNIISGINFGYSSDFVIAVPSTSVLGFTYKLYDIYNICPKCTATPNVTFLGSWNKYRRLDISLEGTKFARRANFHGIIIRTAFFYSKYKPTDVSLADYFQDYASSPKDGQSRFGFIILTHLSDLLNFKLYSHMADQWKVGDVTGPIFRALINEEIDITGTPAIMNVKRTYFAKFLHQSWSFRSCFIFRSPQPKHIKVRDVLKPFETEAWYLSILLYILGVWIMASFFHYENFDSYSNIIIRYSDSFLMIIGAISQQGTDIKMRRLSTRIGFICLIICSFLIYNYYSASIVSVRLSDSIFKLNDSLAELAKTKLKLSSEWMEFFELLIKKQDWETIMFYTKRWIHVPEADRFMDPESAIHLVQTGDLAYHTHPDVGYPFINRYFSNREICELAEVHLARPVLLTFAINFNSSLSDPIRIGLTKISEVGLSRRQILRWTTRKPQCHKNILSASSLDIYEFAPQLLILIFGMIFSVVMYIFEIAWCNSIKKKKNKKPGNRSLRC